MADIKDVFDKVKTVSDETTLGSGTLSVILYMHPNGKPTVTTVHPDGHEEKYFDALMSVRKSVEDMDINLTDSCANIQCELTACHAVSLNGMCMWIKWEEKTTYYLPGEWKV